MNLKEVEKIVGGLKSHLFRNSNSFSVGMLKSHFKGAGIQFKEHQVYTPGDDVRFIDWKLSAKTSHTFVKTFEEERNVEIIVFLDLAQTMSFGYKDVSKLQASIELTCLLYLLAEKSKDLVRTIIIADELRILPTLSGHKGISLLISELEKCGAMHSSGRVNNKPQEQHSVELKKIMNLIKSYVAKGKEVVLFSDFYRFLDNADFKKLLVRNNFHGFRVLSPIDVSKKMPYSIFGSSRLGMKGKLMSVNKKNIKELETGRWKDLLVSNRYLEDFVRNML
jgi:hypothetical protein